jgi:MFS family permease
MTPEAPSPGHARLAVAGLFFTNGALFANLLPRYPDLKRELGLSNAELGLAIAAFPLGSLLAGLAAAALIRRFRSARVAVASAALLALGVLLAGLAPSGGLFAAALGFAGAMDAITDVAQNSHGLRVQRLYGRSILHSLHAIWSIGAVTGGLLGGAAASLAVPRGLHLGASAAFFVGLVALCARHLLPGPEPRAPREPVEAMGDRAVVAPRRSAASPARRGLVRGLLLAAFVLLAAAGALVEDAGGSWAALYLRSLGAGVALASLGFVALVGAQFIGRITGDRLVDRFGQRRVTLVGGALTLLGMGAALAFPGVAGTIAGFAAAGLGIATVVPAAMHAADELPGLAPGTGLAAVSWLMRLGFLLSPPAVGLVADAVGLRAGLLVVPLAGLLVAGLSRVLPARRRAS